MSGYVDVYIHLHEMQHNKIESNIGIFACMYACHIYIYIYTYMYAFCILDPKGFVMNWALKFVLFSSLAPLVDSCVYFPYETESKLLKGGYIGDFRV